MALEELLRQQGNGEKQAASQAGTRDRGSLIQQAGEMFSLPEEGFPVPDSAGDPPEVVTCEDGYVRRSPVQPYLVAEDYQKRRIRKAVTVAAVVLLAVLLLVALVKAHLIHL